MPRRARERSGTGIYHVMARGINKQIIFKDNEDYGKFIGAIDNYKDICGYKIYAFCLMKNHIHLLIKEGREGLGIVFRRIGASFVYWYNRKHKRVGHLFQDRYKSEAVENDKYFLTVLRYIHQNPVKAGIVDNIAKYQWSSYKEYLGKRCICDTDYALNLFSSDRDTAISLFKEFNMQKNDDKCLEYEEPVMIDDIQAAELIKKMAEVEDPMYIQNFAKEKRDIIIRELKIRGLSIRQIERITGVSFAIIRKL